MISIAICDDDTVMTTVIEEMFCKIAKDKNFSIDCSVFFDGSTLVENIRQGTYYDLIYLDIEMHKVNGINAAELIRSMFFLYLQQGVYKDSIRQNSLLCESKQNNIYSCGKGYEN